MEYEITQKLMTKMKYIVFAKLSESPLAVKEDIYSQSLLQLVQGMKNFRGDGSIDAFAIGVIQNVFFDYLKSVYSERKLIDREMLLYKSSYSNSFEKHIEYKEYDEDIRKKFEALTPRQKQFAHSIIMCDITPGEACFLLGISPIRGRKMIAEIRDTLQKTFKEKYEKLKEKKYHVVI